MCYKFSNLKLQLFFDWPKLEAHSSIVTKMSINFFILFIAWAANFQSGNTDDQTFQNELSMKQFGAYLQKKLVTEGNAVYDVLVDLFNDLICKNEECLAIKKEFYEQSRLMPYIHFDCCMKFATVGATNLYDHVTGVAHVRVRATTTDPWPDRLQKIIEESKHMYTGRDAEDDLTNYNKWLTYVTDNPLKLRIGKGENHDRPWRHDRERQWKFVATYLQGNLTHYYNNLDPITRKERYGNDKSNFLQTFAAVIQRGYRVGCYYHDALNNKLTSKLQETFPNGTNYFFESAFEYHEPLWRFPMEHIEMYNILITATHNVQTWPRHLAKKEIDLMFPALKIFKKNNDDFIIPGKKNCAVSSLVTIPPRTTPRRNPRPTFSKPTVSN